MKRRRMISMTAGLIASGLAILAGSQVAAAQSSETDQVRAAFDAFTAALNSLDSNKMAQAWAHEPIVMQITPRDKSVSVGWEAVSQNWEATFGHFSQLNVRPKDGPYIHINGNVAWASGIALESGKLKTGEVMPETTVIYSHVYEKQGDHWLMVSNSAWFAPK